MEPYYQDSHVTIYNGDSLDVLPTLTLPTLDRDVGPVLITDPPYAMVNRYGETEYMTSGRNARIRTRALSFEMDEGETVIDDVVNILALAVPRVNALHIFCDPEHYGMISQLARGDGMTVKPWARIKRCPPPPMPGNWWPSAFELAMFGFRVGAWFGDNDGKRNNTFVADGYRPGIRAYEKVAHPTQKWLPMVQYLVGAMVPPDGLVIDPFMGSGTTLRAAKNLNRRAIGIEVQESYCEIAVQRMMQEPMLV